jgi:hypothetical protein
MKVEVFRNTVKRRGKGASFEMIKAWAQGIKAAGDEAVWIEGKGDPEKYAGEPKEKVAVHFGYGPDSAGDFLKGNRRKIRQHHEKHGGVCVSFDGGIWTSMGNRATDWAKHYYRCGLWSPMNDGNFLNQNSPGDRWQKIESYLSTKSRPWRTKGDHILLCTQPIDNWSMSRTNTDPYKWVDEVIEKLKGKTDRPIKLRPHPNHAIKCAQDMAKKHPQIEVTNVDKGGGPTANYRFTFLEELDNCWAAVTHNSTAAVDAATYGVPVFLTSDLCLAWDVGNANFDKIENPATPDRTQWLNDLAYANWTIDEVKSGIVWKRFRPHIEQMLTA